jgi:hypothetical protein
LSPSLWQCSPSFSYSKPSRSLQLTRRQRHRGDARSRFCVLLREAHQARTPPTTERAEYLLKLAERYEAIASTMRAETDRATVAEIARQYCQAAEETERREAAAQESPSLRDGSAAR